MSTNSGDSINSGVWKSFEKRENFRNSREWQSIALRYSGSTEEAQQLSASSTGVDSFLLEMANNLDGASSSVGVDDIDEHYNTGKGQRKCSGRKLCWVAFWIILLLVGIIGIAYVLIEPHSEFSRSAGTAAPEIPESTVMRTQEKIETGKPVEGRPIARPTDTVSEESSTDSAAPIPASEDPLSNQAPDLGVEQRNNPLTDQAWLDPQHRSPAFVPYRGVSPAIPFADPVEAGSESVLQDPILATETESAQVSNAMETYRYVLEQLESDSAPNNPSAQHFGNGVRCARATFGLGAGCGAATGCVLDCLDTHTASACPERCRLEGQPGCDEALLEFARDCA